MRKNRESDSPKAWELVAFTVLMIAFMAVMMLGYNSVVPAYQ